MTTECQVVELDSLFFPLGTTCYDRERQMDCLFSRNAVESFCLAGLLF